MSDNPTTNNNDTPQPQPDPRLTTILSFLSSPARLSTYGRVLAAHVLAKDHAVFVVTATTEGGHDLAIKMRGSIDPSEGDMADFVARVTQKGVTGRVYETERVVVEEEEGAQPPWEVGVMVGDRVPGETVASVWGRLGWLERRGFRRDLVAGLGEMVGRMRGVRMGFVGRVGGSEGGGDGQGPPQRASNFYDGPVGGYFGPFTGADPEKEFDEWAVSQLPSPEEQAKWRVKLEKDRLKRAGGGKPSFVLTHGDLTWNNVMVAKDDASGRYRVTGLIDWGRSAFLPEYAEHAVLSVVSFHDKEWLKVLKEAVPTGGCSSDRLEFTRVLQRACNPMARVGSFGMGKW